MSVERDEKILAELVRASLFGERGRRDGHEPPRCQKCDREMVEALFDEWYCKHCGE